MKFNKILTVLVVIFLILATFTACTKSLDDNNSSKIVVTDSNNNEIHMDQVPKRIISCAPNITEIIYALEKGDNMVGRSDYCDYPEEVLSVESIGSLYEPNIEKIISLQPDIVFVSSHFTKDNYDKLVNAGIKVPYINEIESFDEMYKVLKMVGKLIGAKNKAEETVDNMKDKVETVKKAVEGKEKVKVYYVIDYGEYGDYTATGDTFISKMIEIAGGINIASDGAGWQYSIEKIIEKNPDVVVCSMYNNMKLGLINANGYKDLPAIKEGRLYEVDNNKIDRPGTPRLADGLLELAKIIHPEAFK